MLNTSGKIKYLKQSKDWDQKRKIHQENKDLNILQPRSYLDYKVHRKNKINMPDDNRDRVPRTTDSDLSNDKTDIQNDEKKSEDSEVDILNNSPEPPMDELLIAALDRRPCWIIALRYELPDWPPPPAQLPIWPVKTKQGKVGDVFWFKSIQHQ